MRASSNRLGEIFLLLVTLTLVDRNWGLATEGSNQIRGNEILIIGPRTESRSKEHAGQALVIEPRQASRFDTFSHVQKQSSMTSIETGKITPTGATLPRIRGHDAKLTEIAVEDFPLQNPYGGLPLVDALDLRAFGRLEIYQGVSPYDLSGTSPAGTLRYRLRREAQTKKTAGFQGGRPYGLSTWGLFVSGQGAAKPDLSDQPSQCPPLWKSTPSSQETPAKQDFRRTDDNRHGSPGTPLAHSPLHFRLFARHHQTDGQYLFYSDEGTPYNTSDDRIARRTNNDQRSFNMMPVFTLTCGPWSLSGLGWWTKTHGGLPTQSTRVPSLARYDSQQGVFAFGVTHQWVLGRLHPDQTLPSTGSLATPSRLLWSLKALRTQDDHRTLDPGARFLIVGESAQLNLQTTGLISSLHLLTPRFRGLLTGRHSETSVAQDFGSRPSTRLTRQSEGISLGVFLQPWKEKQFIVEAKKSWYQDRSRGRSSWTLFSNEDDTGVASTRGMNDESLTLAWSPEVPHLSNAAFDDLSLYLQGAHSERLPTLYEEFGNGSSISPNPELNAEKIRHRESGLKFTYGSQGDETVLALFKDETEDQIIFVPIYANGSKAFNIRRAKTHGIEVRSQLTVPWNPLFPTTLMGAYSRLWPHDHTRAERVRILPGIPERVIVAELTQKTPWVTVHGVGRYRSLVYRDIPNEVSLPGTWIYDFYADMEILQRSKTPIQVGLMIRNILDTLDLPLAARAASSHSVPSKGRTGLSDLTGSPLPGRQWVISFTADAI